MDYDTKYPILLQGRHITEQIVDRCHRAVLHGGVADTLSKLREKFWLPKATHKIKSLELLCMQETRKP